MMRISSGKCSLCAMQWTTIRWGGVGGNTTIKQQRWRCSAVHNEVTTGGGGTMDDGMGMGEGGGRGRDKSLYRPTTDGGAYLPAR